jgi:hypothetical protein
MSEGQSLHFPVFSFAALTQRTQITDLVKVTTEIAGIANDAQRVDLGERPI